VPDGAGRAKEAKMFRSVLALLMIVLAAPACAGSRFSGGFQGGGSGGDSHGGDSHDDGAGFAAEAHQRAKAAQESRVTMR
jgi:hypothetical protein